MLTSRSMGSEHNPSWKEFGPFLQHVRRRGISQGALAQMLKCHRTYIWRLEHGRNRPSSIFLNNLRMTVTLSPQEIAALEGFELLRW